MTRIARECTAGIVAAVGLLGCLFVLSMPWWLAIGLAAGLYIGLRVSLPVAVTSHDIVHAGAVTEAERQALLTDGRRHLVALQALAHDIRQVRPAFAPALDQLCQRGNDLLTAVERKPDTARFAGMLPLYLDKLVANLTRYLTLARLSADDAAANQQLGVTEEMAQSANTAFERLMRQLSKDDWLALEAEAESLKTLFEMDFS